MAKPAACRDAVSDLLPWYLNGTLEKGQEDTVRRHLQSCPLCRSELELLSRFSVALEEKFKNEPPVGARATPRRFQLWSGAAAALVLLATGAALWRLGDSGREARQAVLVSRGEAVLDLGAGPDRGTQDIPWIASPEPGQSVRLRFAPPLKAEAAYEVTIHREGGTVVYRGQPGPLRPDASGRSDLVVPGDRLSEAGNYQLVVRKTSGQPTADYVLPFEVRPPSE